MVAQWLERPTDDRMNAGSNPTGATSKPSHVHLPLIARVFRMSHYKSVLSGVYARGSRRSDTGENMKSLVTKRDTRQGEKIVLPPRKDRL